MPADKRRCFHECPPPKLACSLLRFHDQTETPDGQAAIDVVLDQDTVWLDQQQLSELFKTDRTSIVKHIRNIYNLNELDETATSAIFAQVRQEGKRKIKRDITRYNLDLIISVGYRVNSIRGTQFRIRANSILKDYLV